MRLPEQTRRLSTAGLCMTFCMTLFVSVRVATGSLGDYRWQHRLLVLVAPDATDVSVQQVRQSLAHHADELADRNLLVLQLFLHDQSLVEGRPVSGTEAAGLRAELGVEQDARMLLLVGKDGLVKRRAALVTDLQVIFSQIDAMPMRRIEMRQRGENGGQSQPALQR
jgi:hypothetical protein